MAETSIQHVSDTAFLVAAYRSVESERPNALFHDPLAARLAGERGRELAEAFPTKAMTGWMVAVRTVLIDRYVRDAVAAGVDTVVNLGAGLDTRPYRLDLPAGLRWIEVDYPDVVAFKKERLAGETPRVRLERVGVDLTDDAARRELFAELADRGGKLLVLCEGVVPYLTNEQAAALADDLHGLGNVDGWIVDYVSPESHAYRQRAGVTRHMRRTPFQFQPGDWFAFFAAHGWRPREMRYLPEEGARIGRPPPLPLRFRLLGWLLRPLVPPERRSHQYRWSGYALLEKKAPSKPL